MNNQVGRWIKRRLKEMQLNSYAFGESPKEVERYLQMERSKILKLDQNENFFIPREKLLALVIEALEDLDPRLYPQDEEERLREKLGAYVGLSTNYISIGNGGDEIIERIVHLFLGRGEQALTISPTFPMYRYAVSLQRARLIEVPLKADFSLDVNSLLSKTTTKTKVLFLCSPNNPTANQFEIGEVKHLIESFPGMVVMDEAYVEFADYSLASLIKKYENLIVIRTFSKAFGLAGLRLGYCIGDPEVIRTLSKNVGLPYPVNTVSLKVGLKVLENINMVMRAVEEVRMERDKLIKALNGIDGIKAFNSKTNFVLFNTEKPSNEIHRKLLERGILIRKIGVILDLQNCLRTTVGLPWMNIRLIEALREICLSSFGS